MGAEHILKKMSREELDSIFEAARTIDEARKTNITGRGEHQKGVEGLMAEWYPGISTWKIYNAMRILGFFEKFEEILGKARFQQKPLWTQLADRGLVLASLYLFTEERYQQAPLIQFITDILEGKTEYQTANQIEKALQNWFISAGVPLATPKPRQRKPAPTEKVIEEAATKEAEEKQEPEQQLPSSEKKEKIWNDKLSKIDTIAIFRAGEDLVHVQDHDLVVPPKTLQSYMKEKYPHFSFQQLYQAMRVVRVLTPYQEQIGDTFQFAERPIYLQLVDKDIAYSAIYSFTKDRYQAAPIKKILKDILMGNFPFTSITKIEKYLEEQSKETIEASPIPLTITEPEEEQEETPEEALADEQEATPTMETLLEKTLPWRIQPLPIPTRFPLVLKESPLPGERRKIIIKENQQLLPESLEFMRIYVVAQGSNGVMTVSRRFIYCSREHHGYDPTRFAVKRTDEDNRERIQQRVNGIKVEMEHVFKNRYPKARIASFEEIYAQSRINILTYLTRQHYYVVDFGSERFLPHEPKKRGRKKKIQE